MKSSICSTQCASWDGEAGPNENKDDEHTVSLELVKCIGRSSKRVVLVKLPLQDVHKVLQLPLQGLCWHACNEYRRPCELDTSEVFCGDLAPTDELIYHCKTLWLSKCVTIEWSATKNNYAPLPPASHTRQLLELMRVNGLAWLLDCDDDCDYSSSSHTGGSQPPSGDL